MQHGHSRKKELLDRQRPLSAALLEQLDAGYDIELTYSSNAIEGNTLTRSETAIVIEKGLTVRGKPLKDHEEAVDHFEALRFVRSLALDSRPITEADVRSIHRLVVARTQSREAGKYGSHQRFISGSDVKLPSPTEVPLLMVEFCTWLVSAELTHQNAIEAHLQLVSIHPFSDGNGRTSRLLMNLLLLRGGWPAMVIQPEERTDYIDGLERVQVIGDRADYDQFMLNSLERSLDDYLEKIGVTPESIRPKGRAIA
jgi:Fic family protein